MTLGEVTRTHAPSFLERFDPLNRIRRHVGSNGFHLGWGLTTAQVGVNQMSVSGNAYVTLVVVVVVAVPDEQDTAAEAAPIGTEWVFCTGWVQRPDLATDTEYVDDLIADFEIFEGYIAQFELHGTSPLVSGPGEIVNGFGFMIDDQEDRKLVLFEYFNYVVPDLVPFVVLDGKIVILSFIESIADVNSEHIRRIGLTIYLRQHGLELVNHDSSETFDDDLHRCALR
jgi:hypothetical protein